MTSIEQRDVQVVLAGIDDLLPKLRERAQLAEDQRQVPYETVNELDEIGFFKLLQPEQWGVRRPTRRTSTRRSGGWRARAAPPAGSARSSVCTTVRRCSTRRPQDEVWGDDPSVRVSPSYAPMGAGIVVDGGYLVSGAWQWSSGSEHASWGVPRRPGDQGRPPGRLR